MKMSNTVKFFLLYFFLIISLVVSAVLWSKDYSHTPIEQTHTEEMKALFSDAMAKYELKQEEKRKENEGKWTVSNEFAVTAVTLGAIFDIVFILLWARYENKKREGEVQPKKRWTDSKWFWNIVAFGVVQPKNNRLVINWKNFILFVIMMYVLKLAIFRMIEQT
ncbi:hypothetical protein ACFSCX_15865 [Bacillus salitolerans]|uniref:DUF4306 domain-containing protein n=1 Tax=Bacillus salitolerans TaxID=1437434 RepID=A0ABW4LV70_9BACI